MEVLHSRSADVHDRVKKVHRVVDRHRVTEDVVVLVKSPMIMIVTRESAAMRRRRNVSEVAREIGMIVNVTSVTNRDHVKENATRRRKNASRNSLTSKSKRNLSMVS